MKFIPREYQKIAIDWIREHPRCALFLPMGSGKSSSVLSAIDTFPVLIVAPLRVAQTTWPDEVRKWNFPYTYSVIKGNPKERLQALSINADIYMINYENLIWLVEYYGAKWPFKTIVCDECVRLKGFRLRQGSKQAKALAKVAHGTKKFIALTGTPTPNGPIDLWGQIWFIDKGQRLGRSFSIFTDQWFRLGYDGFSLEPVPNAVEDIQNQIKDVSLSIKISDYFNIDEPIVNKIYIDIPEKSRKKYDEMEKEMYIEINDVGIEAFNAASKTIKTLQLCNGFIYREDKSYEILFDDKLQALEEIINNSDGPVLVSYQFKADLERLLKFFPQGKHLDKDPQTIKDWNDGLIPILFAHPASAGHGLNLQYSCNVLVFFSIGWNLEHHEQIIERIGPLRQKQAGFDRPVYIHYILTKDTIEDIVKSRLETKSDVQQTLLNYLNRKNNDWSKI
jgi:SNF2 family DNA or RNA helicase